MDDTKEIRAHRAMQPLVIDDALYHVVDLQDYSRLFDDAHLEDRHISHHQSPGRGPDDIIEYWEADLYNTSVSGRYMLVGSGVIGSIFAAPVKGFGRYVLFGTFSQINAVIDLDGTETKKGARNV